MSKTKQREFLNRTAADGLILGMGAAGVQAVAARKVAPGQHEIAALPYPYDSLKGLSQQLITWHHDKHYAGYVKNRNKIETALAAMNPGSDSFDAMHYAGLKKSETFNACGQILHEVYFDSLGGDGRPDSSSRVAEALGDSFGSLTVWQASLKACAAAAGVGWGVTCWDPSCGRLANFVVESHQLGAVWGAIPIVCLDAWEHAFYHDYGPEKIKYFDVFFLNLNWGRIDDHFRKMMP